MIKIYWIMNLIEDFFSLLSIYFSIILASFKSIINYTTKYYINIIIIHSICGVSISTSLVSLQKHLSRFTDVNYIIMPE